VIRYWATLLFAAALARAGSALVISSATAPAGGFAQIAIYAVKPAAISAGHLVVTLDQTFFANAPKVGLFGANGDALGLATVNWPQIDIQFSSASGGIGVLAGLPVIVISAPVLATATGTSVVSATSPDGSATVVNGSVTAQGTLSVGKIPAGLGVAPAGTVVPMTGTGFTAATKVAIDGVAIASSQFVSATEIDITLGGAAELVGKRARVTDGGVEFDYFCFQPNDPADLASAGAAASAQPLFPLFAGLGFTGGSFYSGSYVAVENPNPTTASVTINALYISRGLTISNGSPSTAIPPGGWEIFFIPAENSFALTSTLHVRTVGMQVEFPQGLAVAPTMLFNPATLGPAAPALTPASLQFTWQAGTSTAPAARTVTVAASSSITATTSSGWLSASTAFGQFNQQTISVSVNPFGLAAGTYQGSVLISQSYGLSATLPVALTLAGAPVGMVAVSPASVAFNAPVSTAAPYSQTIAVTSDSGPLPFTVSTVGGGAQNGPYPWLKVSPMSGTTPATLTVTWDSAVTSTIPYSELSTPGAIVISSPANVVTIPATFNVTGVQTYQTSQGAAGFGPSGLAFSAQIGGPPQTEPIFVNPQGTMTATVDQLWMTAVPLTSGDFANAAVNVTVNPAGLAQGVYTGNVTIAEPGLASIVVPVTLGVYGTAPPHPTITKGSFTFVQQVGEPTPPYQSAEIDSAGLPIPLGFATGGNWLHLVNNFTITPAPIQVGALAIPPFAPGEYDGSFTVTSPGGTIYVPVTYLVVPGPVARPVLSQVANAASGIVGGVSPGEIVELRGYGSGASLIGGLQLTSSGTVATGLNGLAVTFDGVPAPLIYTSATQTNLVVPYEVAGKVSTTMQLTYNSMQTAAWVLPVAATAPGIFTVDSTGTGQAAVVNQDGTVNSASNPAVRGSVVSIYATGEGQTSPAGVTGSVTKAPNAPLANVTVSIGGVGATVQYAGSAPGDVAGVLQVNAAIPASIAPGTQPVVLTIGGVASQAGVTVGVK